MRCTRARLRCLVVHSEARRIAAAEPVAIARLVVGHRDDHLIELRSNLHTACETAASSLRASRTVQGTSLGARHRVHLLEERVSYDDMALSAADAGAIVIEWHLVGSKCVLEVATVAVGEDARGSVALQHVKQALARVGSVAARNTIGRNHINPNAA